MEIQQETNGNIIIRDNSGVVLHILPSMHVHKHPRKENAILITSSVLGDREDLGISILASEVGYINKESFTGNVERLKALISEKIAINGVLPFKKELPITKEQDPNYTKYLQANTFEKLLDFIKAHQSNIGGQTLRDGKLIEEEYYCQFETFIIRVVLRYTYKTDAPELIASILMYGSTQYVFQPKKVYKYDTNNTLTGYSYQEPY